MSSIAPNNQRAINFGLNAETGAIAATSAISGDEPGSPMESPRVIDRVRILTLNMHKGFSLFNQFILPELREGIRSLSPDIVFLQEVHGSNIHHAERHAAWPASSQYEFLADNMWPEFSYGRNAVYPHGDHGNALLSKYPIIEFENVDISIGNIEQRGILHTRLKVPGHDQVHAICVHLGLRESHRRQQLGALCELIERLPPSAPVIVAGDFNDWRKRADAILARCNLREAFVNEHAKPAKSFPARWPLLCLDRIYVRNASTHNAQVLFQQPWSHLSDHAPLTVEIHL